MVEIISLPDSPVILTNRCYEIRTAVTPNRVSDTAAVLRDLKSLRKGPRQSRKRCKIVTIADHSNQNRMSSSSGAYFHQSCHVTKACVSLNWHQRRQTCRVLRRESACCHQQCAATVVYSPWCISATSVKFPLRKCANDDAFACQSSALDRNSEGRRLKIRRVEPIGVTHPLWKIPGYATDSKRYTGTTNYVIIVGRSIYLYLWQLKGRTYVSQSTQDTWNISIVC